MCGASSSKRGNTYRSYNFVHPLGDQIARHAEEDQTDSDPREPLQVAFVFLTGHPDVHSPETCYDVHREHDSAQNGQLAENVGSLLLSLVHADVDLR